MCSQKFHLHDSIGGSALAIRITPRSARNEIVEVTRDGTVRIRLKASQAEDTINHSLVNFLANILEIGPDQIEIVAGSKGKDKLVSILNMDADTVHKKLLSHL